MTTQGSDKTFSGSIPDVYNTLLVPLIFETYARDLAARVGMEPVARVLEIGAGTGVVTRAMVDALGTGVKITATDLNKPMLDYARTVRGDPAVEWLQADAMALPFGDRTFDAVVCQFAAMFFPDRAKAYSEALRVLKPGGRFCFNVWDDIGENEFADTVTRALAGVFPDDPPRFMARVPHGYSDTARIAADLRAGGFSTTPVFETVAARSRAAGPAVPAAAYCLGTPLLHEILARDAALLDHAKAATAAAIAGRFGSGEVDGKIQAHIVTTRA